MVPRVAQRRDSFEKAGLYYLHDKKAQTTERVAWTHTVNLGTNDASLAMKHMAFTASCAEDLKREAGVSSAGRKSKAGSVYAFSLAWSPEENPQPEHMKQSALDTLEILGLKDHEAVLVAHIEESVAHDHVHIICNLVHPETGRTAVPSYDFLSLSTWAEKYEKDHTIYCKQRIENNKLRKQEAAAEKQLALIKHREKELAQKKLIQQLYQQSENGKKLDALLKEQDLVLCKGDRRGFVLVDRDGEASSLSRQLKGVRAAELKQKLGDLKELPQAREVIHDILHFDRDKYEADRQKAIVDAAIDHEESKEGKNSSGTIRVVSGEEAYDESHLHRLDELRAKEQHDDRQRWKLQGMQDDFYKRSETAERLKKIDGLLQRNVGGNITGRTAQLLELREKLLLNLQNIDQRTTEQDGALEIKLNPPANDSMHEPDSETEPRPRLVNQFRQGNNLRESSAGKDVDPSPER